MWKTSTIHTVFVCFKRYADIFASSEDRTHDLEIMRLRRCLLRYRGTSEEINSIVIKRPLTLSSFLQLLINTYIYD